MCLHRSRADTVAHEDGRVGVSCRRNPVGAVALGCEDLDDVGIHKYPQVRRVGQRHCLPVRPGRSTRIWPVDAETPSQLATTLTASGRIHHRLTATYAHPLRLLVSLTHGRCLARLGRGGR